MLELAEAAKGLPLVVVGDGPLRDHVPDTVGFVPPAELPGYFDRAAVVVCPSRREGYGVVARQAMAHARPVVATAVGGLAEAIVDEETGLLVPPGDVAGAPGRARAAARRRGAAAEPRCRRPRTCARALFAGRRGRGDPAGVRDRALALASCREHREGRTPAVAEDDRVLHLPCSRGARVDADRLRRTADEPGVVVDDQPPRACVWEPPDDDAHAGPGAGHAHGRRRRRPRQVIEGVAHELLQRRCCRARSSRRDPS